MIRFDGVTLRYASDQASRATPGHAVLATADWTVPSGGFRWLRGHSGAGKTSVLRLLNLSLRATGGRVSVFDTDVTAPPRSALPALRRRIGVVYQDFRLLPALTVFDNVALPLRVARRPEAQIATQVLDLLDWVGLADRAASRPPALSGGEQQRVALARAVIHRPDLLLADEPTGNLDATQAHRVMVLLTEMNRQGTTVVVATHSDRLVAAHPNVSVRIEDGRLTEHPA